MPRQLRKLARRLAGDRLGDGADVVGRGAAAAADDVDEAGVGELAEQRRHVLRALVVVAEFVGQAGIGIGADEGIGEARRSRRYGRASPSAPSAQLRPMVSGWAWRTEFQNAAGVWPDSVRPERSVIVPEIITGRSTPRSSHDLRDGEDRRLGVERVEDGLDQEEVGAAVDQARAPARHRRRAARRR